MKKTLFIYLVIYSTLLNSNYTFAQENFEKIILNSDTVFCFIDKKINDYTGTTTVNTGFLSFLHGQYLIQKKHDIIGLYISLEGLKFKIIQDNNFYIKFTDNSIIKFTVLEKQLSGNYNNGKYSNSFFFTLLNDKKELLKTKKIYGMRFGEYDEYLFNEYDSNQFYEMINCIIQTKK
jgi:hypothetical protein